MMNQLLTCILAVAVLAASASGILPSAAPAAPSARTAAAYTVTSVTDCAKTSAQYDRFYESGGLGPVIPGLAEGLVPQGIAWLPEEDQLLYCGYRSDKGNSALIAADRQTGEIRKIVHLLYKDGSDYSGHAGGVCATEDDIYISNAKHLYRISLEHFRSLPEESRCAFDEEIPVPVNASFCNCAEGVLWVGEFQYTGDYPTDPSHAVRGRDGMQRAWICGYRMEGRTDFGSPDCILSVTERIQGMTVRDGRIYLSQSYGRRADSVIMRYDGVLERAPDTSAVLDGREIPLWILDSGCRSGTLLCPPMTECLCTVGEEVYVLFESAAQPYMDPKKPSLNPIDRAFILQGF